MPLANRRRSRPAQGGHGAVRAAARGASGAEAPPPAEVPWAEAACLLAGSLTPLLFHPFGTLGFEATKATLIRLLALVLVLGWAARRAAGLRLGRAWVGMGLALPRGPLRLVVLAVGGYLLSLSVATALSIAPAASLWGSYDRIQGLITVAAWLVLGSAAAVAARRLDRREVLVQGWLLASVPACLYACAQQFRLDPIEWLGRPLGVTSMLGSSTALGTYLAMLAPLTLARVVGTARLVGREEHGAAHGGPWWRPALRRSALVYAGWIALLVLQVLVVLLARVRGGTLGLLVGLGVCAMGLTWRLGRRQRTLGVAVATALAVAVVAVTVASSSFASLVGPGVGGEAGEPGSERQRLLIWQASLETVAAAGWRALLGFGPETQAVALERRFPAELANRFPDARFDRAHNLILDQLLTTGVVGVAALGAVLAMLAQLGLQALRGRPVGEAVLAAGLLGGIAANVVAGLYAFDSITTAALFWLMAGLLIAPSRPERAGATAPPLDRRRRGARAASERGRLLPPERLAATAWLASGALALAALPALLALLMADLYHTRALALRAGEAPAASVAEELSATAWAPWQDVYQIALGATYVEIARTVASRDGRLPLVDDDPPQSAPSGREELLRAARLAFEHTVELSPRDPYSQLHLARFLTLWSEVTRDPAERAERLVGAADGYERAIALSPNRARFYDELGLVSSRLGRSDEAISRYRQAEALDRPTSERLARIGDAEAVRGNSEAARAWYGRALALDPRSAAAEHALALLDRGAGQPGAALEHAQRAARFQMRNWLYQRDLALVHADLQEWPQARAAARAARRLAPSWEWEELSALIESYRR